MTTVIIFWNHYTRQHYIRLHSGTIDDTEKERLLKSMSAVNAGEFDYSHYPKNCNILFFQEFENPDTIGVYYNINGDRPIYDLLQTWGREPEYYI